RPGSSSVVQTAADRMTTLEGPGHLAQASTWTDRSPEPSPLAELRMILTLDLPTLPTGAVGAVAAELRSIDTPRAGAVWRHSGWAAICGWIWRYAGSCDPTVPAIHAVRRAPRVREDPKRAAQTASYLLSMAQDSPIRERRREVLAVDFDPIDPV